ncbi:hypothetical protein [Nocardia brasiliensis]|uniref:hypothetical protein n=1 Tax=Nocardia brasiliensis TaxID=37326 RepID=UPI003D8A3F03
MIDVLLGEAQRFLEWVKGTTTELDASDGSVFFIQTALESMAKTPGDDPMRTVQCLAYSIYVADLLADRCQGVRRVVEREGAHLSDVLAVRDDGSAHSTLSWIEGCLDDPRSDDIVFRYAGALRDFGAFDRARAIYTKLSEGDAAWSSGE